MKEFADRFVYSDFTVYFFPGVFLLVGGLPYALAFWGKTDLSTALNTIGIGEAALLLPVAYALGAILAGFRPAIVSLAARLRIARVPSDEPRAMVAPRMADDAVKKRFQEVFPLLGTCPSWSENHFYAARSWVEEHRPRLALLARRQNALASFRQNLVLPSIAWGAGLLTWVLHRPDAYIGLRCTLVLIAVLLIALVPRTLLRRAQLNLGREVREICLGFLVYSESKPATDTDEEED